MPRYDFKKSSATSFSAVIADSTSDTLQVSNEPLTFVAQLNVSAAATEVGDILRVWVQTSYDGTNWHDIGSFANVLGNGGAVVRRMSWATGNVTTAEELKQDAAVTAGTVRNGPCGGQFRLKYTVTDAGADNASFTFTALLWAVE